MPLPRISVCLLLLCCFCFRTACATIQVVAAENFYGNVAELIGGDYVKVDNIISNPDTDPHLFSTSANTAIALNDADVIIYNGAGYDPWIEPLLNAQAEKAKTKVINVAELMNVKKGANPHLWFKPETLPALASKLAEVYSQIEPSHRKTFLLNLQTFLARDKKITVLIEKIKARYGGTKITATEPVFGYMTEALGLISLDPAFQQAIMNDSEPTPGMLMAFQKLLTDKTVKVLFYNEQVHDTITENLMKLAKDNHIAVVGIHETLPKDANVITWISTLLEKTEAALAEGNATKKINNS